MSACTAISAQGTTFEVGSTGSPTEFTEIGGVKTYSGFDGSRTENDTTCLTSPAKEFRLGLRDEGNFQMDVMEDFDDAGQEIIRDALSENDPRQYRITYPNGKVRYFYALAKSFDEKGEVDGIVMSTIQLRITGLGNIV